MTIDELLAIEEIRNLRLEYSACFDHQDLDAYQGSMGYVGSEFDSLHVVTNPLIKLTGPTTATGRWYLLDLLTRQKPMTALETRGGHDNPLRWLALYEDDYRKVGGAGRSPTAS